MTCEGAIDVHAHFLPPAYLDALARENVKTVDNGITMPSWDVGKALGFMDSCDISCQILSISSPFLSFVRDEDKATLCRSINDYSAALRQSHPRRFGAYMILPLDDIALALAEARRCLEQLSLDGLAMPTNLAGLYPGNPHFAPLYEYLNEKGATVFIHPTSPCCFEALGLQMPTPVIEFPFETTRAATSLLFEGTLRRYPAIRFILPHAGGTLPFLADRISAIGASPLLGDRAIALEEATQGLESFHFDLALGSSQPQFEALKSFVPLTQVLFGTDFPFAPPPVIERCMDRLRRFSLTEAERADIMHRNAARLFPNLV